MRNKFNIYRIKLENAVYLATFLQLKYGYVDELAEYNIWYKYNMYLEAFNEHYDRVYESLPDDVVQKIRYSTDIELASSSSVLRTLVNDYSLEYIFKHNFYDENNEPLSAYKFQLWRLDKDKSKDIINMFLPKSNKQLDSKESITKYVVS